MKNEIDLRYLCPGVYNQGTLGSCTANAIAAAYEFNEIVDNEKNILDVVNPCQSNAARAKYIHIYIY